MIKTQMALVLLYHVFLTVFFCPMTSYATVSRTYEVQMNSTGSSVCAVEKPSTVIPMAARAMRIHCGGLCNGDPSCELFQFKEDLAQCELFKYSPSNFSPIDHCTAYSALPRGIHTNTLVSSWSGAAQVLATAILNGQLFVTRYNVSKVSVYNTVTFQQVRQITFPGLGPSLYGLATSAINNYLYISDFRGNCVHRVDLSVTGSNSVQTWNAPGGPRGLSMTTVDNVIVVSNDKGMKEYTSNGSLVRVINMTNFLWHAVEVNKDIWAFTVKSPMHGICTTLTNGTLIKCFTGSEAGSGITQMNSPRHLAVDPRGHILVADRNNNQTLTVDPSLTEARHLSLPINTTLIFPMALSFDESRGRLYIGEDGGQNKVLVFDGYW